MLSIENSSPDPPCPCQLPHLNTGGDEIEKAHHNLLPLPLPEVDLQNPSTKPPASDQLNHIQLPNFCIRDYVFAARSKDVKKNWPFSLKSLQLCLKHGIKDVLPPFEPLVTVRNQSSKRCIVETSSFEKQDISNFDNECTGPVDHVILDSSDGAQLNNKIAESCIGLSSCRSAEENDFPSTTTSVSQSEIESVPHKRQFSLPSSETDTSAEAQVEAVHPSATQKTESTSRPLGKKCKLIVKFGGHSDRSSTEDITSSNCTTVSETMASKVCPVCKTFSSSSNTTLNAHIDQCLSVESTPKWTTDSKLIRHRIKPRKMKLMLEIYATAQLCTLEELERRNGRSWATVPSLPGQDTEKIETSIECKKKRVPVVDPEGANDVGPVYIDANGTKLRILSKFNNPPPAPKVGESVGARKPTKGGKCGKFISKKKKKHLAQNHEKHLKLASQSRRSFCQKTHGYQAFGAKRGYSKKGKGCEKEHQMGNQTEPSDSGTLRPWVCSRKRGFTKKTTRQQGHQPVKCKWHLPQELHVGDDQLSLVDSLSLKSFVEDEDPSEKLLSSPGNERIENSSHKAKVSGKKKQALGKKRLRSLLVGETISDKVKKSFLPMKRNACQLSKDGTAVHSTCTVTPASSNRSHMSSLSKKKVDANEKALNRSDDFRIAPTKSSWSSHAIITKAMRFSSFRKNMLSASSKFSVGKSISKKFSVLKMSQVDFMTEKDEGVVPWKFEVDQQYASMHNRTGNHYESKEMIDEVSLGRHPDLDSQKVGGSLCISHREDALSWERSKAVPSSYSHGEEVNVDYSVRVGDDFSQKIHGLGSAQNIGEDVLIERSSKTFEGTSATSLAKSIDKEFYKLSNSSNACSNSIQSVEDYKGLLCATGVSAGPTGPNFANDQEMFSSNEVGNVMMGQNGHMRVELDSGAGHQNSFHEVDPILIPGPPGSFLPSPRDMGSEDFQGTSSLSTSQFHSSPDQHDVVDGDSSDSPASTISNSTAGVSDFKFSNPSSSGGTYAVKEKISSGLPSSSGGTKGFEPFVQKAGVVPQATSTGAERPTFDGEYMNFDRLSIERGSLSFNSDQPCCCQKKERFLQPVSLNYQESSLLRRRKIASVTVPAMHMGGNLNPRPNNLDVRPELVPQSRCTVSGSQNVFLPIIEPPSGPIPLKDFPNGGVKFPGRTDSDTASPSAPNPVLRLMGKNLLVVNKDEEAPLPLGPAQPSTPNGHQTSQFPTFFVVSPGTIQNQESISYHHMLSQGTVSFGQGPHNTLCQSFDASFKSHDELKSPQVPPQQLPVGIFEGQRGFAPPTGSKEYKGECNFESGQNRLKSRLIAAPAYNTEKLAATIDCQCNPADSSIHPMQDIIVIDDVPESETCDVTKYNEGWRESGAVPSCISIPTALSYNTSFVPFPSHESHGEASAALCSGSYPAISSRPGNTGGVRRGCISEGSGVMQRSCLTAASSSSGHLRSAALYHYSHLS